MSWIIRPNTMWENYPVRKKPTRNGENEKKWAEILAEEEKEWVRALARFDAQVPYYGHPHDSVLDWRKMVLEVKAQSETKKTLGDGRTAWTIPWVTMICSDLPKKGKTVKVESILKYAEDGVYRSDVSGGTYYRYVYITFKVEEIT